MKRRGVAAVLILGTVMMSFCSCNSKETVTTATATPKLVEVAEKVLQPTSQSEQKEAKKPEQKDESKTTDEPKKTDASKKEKPQEPSPSATPKAAVQVVEDERLKVEYIGMDINSDGSAKAKFRLVNLSKEKYTIVSNSVLVNGEEVTAVFGNTLDGGEKADQTLLLLSDELSAQDISAEDIETITINIKLVMDEDMAVEQFKEINIEVK